MNNSVQTQFRTYSMLCPKLQGFGLGDSFGRLVNFSTCMVNSWILEFFDLIISSIRFNWAFSSFTSASLSSSFLVLSNSSDFVWLSEMDELTATVGGAPTTGGKPEFCLPPRFVLSPPLVLAKDFSEGLSSFVSDPFGCEKISKFYF